MTATLRRRWLITGCVWAAAVCLTLWNLHMAQSVTAAREDGERLRRELAFQGRNAASLASVGRAHDALFLDVESVQLGAVMVQSQLRALGSDAGLERVAVTIPGAQAGGETPLLGLAFHGYLESTVRFLASLQPCPYLSVSHLHLLVDPVDGLVAGEMGLVWRFKIRPPADRVDDRLQASAPPPVEG
jgi:hypothetical protein